MARYHLGVSSRLMRKTRRVIVMLAALVLLAFHHAAPMMPAGNDGMSSGSGMPETMLLAGACLAVASGRVRVALRRILEICLESPARLVTRVIAPVSLGSRVRAIEHPPPPPHRFSLCVIRR